MTKRSILTLVTLALAVSVLAVPAAPAAPWLGGGEARRVLGRQLQRHTKYGAVTGSLRASCYGVSADVVLLHQLRRLGRRLLVRYGLGS